MRVPMKSILCLLIILSVLIMGCTNKNTDYPLLPYPPVIVWDIKAYVVTDEKVERNSIGKQFGEVKRYVDPTKALPEKNEDSTIAPVGSKLYEIKGTDIKNAFAVEMNGELRIAKYSEP